MVNLDRVLAVEARQHESCPLDGVLGRSIRLAGDKPSDDLIYQVVIYYDATPTRLKALQSDGDEQELLKREQTQRDFSRKNLVMETYLKLPEGSTLHIYDPGSDDIKNPLTVFWHHGTPNIGEPPEPLFQAAAQLNIRWVSYNRPGYGGSSRSSDRNIASAAVHVATIADALGIERFAVMGHSGGGPHALACAALLPNRVLSVVSIAGLAPFGASGLDWFAGMTPTGVASLQAAAEGREAKERYEASEPAFDPEMFTVSDHAALAGPWSWLNRVVERALAAGSQGLIDDDLAYVKPWGFDPGNITTPVLLLHGGQDRVVPSTHGVWLEQHCPAAELRLYPNDGHLSILDATEAAMAWLRQHAP